MAISRVNVNLVSGENLVIIGLYVDDFYVFYSKDNSELLSLLENNFNVKNLGTLKDLCRNKCV